MSCLAEKANAARWIRSRVGSGLTDSQAAELWGELEERLEDCRSAGSEEIAIVEWRREVEQQLSTRLLNSPLERTTGR